MNTNQYIVGIDPDTEKNGYAIIDMETRKVSVTTVTLPHLMEVIDNAQAKADYEGKRLTVYVEAGWLCQSNWHIGWRDSKERAAAKGRSVGRNHQRGMDICEMLTYRGINVVQVAPLRKIWGGKDYKITHDELVDVVGPVDHTNQEGRDAALIAWVNAGLPVKFMKH
jgi:hypothetical protein